MNPKLHMPEALPTDEQLRLNVREARNVPSATRRLSLLSAAAMTALLLLGCGGGGGGEAPTLRISGTAAVGDPVVGDVTAECAVGSGQARSSANGAFTVVVTGGAGPCLLRVVDGTRTLYSVASATEPNTTANISTLTDMLVDFLRAGTDRAQWFAEASTRDLLTQPRDLASRVTEDFIPAMKSGDVFPAFSLADAGFLNRAFSATPGDPVDDALEQLKSLTPQQRGNLQSRATVALDRRALQPVFNATVDMAGSFPRHFQGMSVGLRTGDGLTWLRGQGFKDNARTLRSDPTSQYRIGSVTKTFLAVAMLQLVDRGLLSLDDTVAQRLPEVASIVPNSAAITVRDLLQMRSGLPDYLCQESLNFPGRTATVFDEWYEAILNRSDANYTPLQLVQASVQRKFLCGLAKPQPDAPTPQPPRGVFDYANVNYILLGMMAEKIDGRPIERMINEDIVARLGLQGTNFTTGSAFTSTNHAESSASPGTPGLNVTFIGPRVPWASGAMISTPEDLTKWARVLGLNERTVGTPCVSEATCFLKAASFEALKKVDNFNPRDTSLMGNVPATYTLGTYYMKGLGTGSEDLFGHSGSVATWTTSAFYSPSLDLAFAINVTRAGRTAPWFPTYGAGEAYGGELKSRFNPPMMLWSLERNLKLARESTGTCKALGATVLNGNSGSCSGDSVRTSSLSVNNGALTINTSGKTFNQTNVITVENPNHWTGFDASVQSSAVPRPSLAFFGNGSSGVTIGDGGRVTLVPGALAESTGVGSAVFTVAGQGSELNLAGTVVAMGADTVALRVAQTARAARVTLAAGSKVQGDIVVSGDVTLQIDGEVSGSLRVVGTSVTVTGSGRVTGGVQFSDGGSLKPGSVMLPQSSDANVGDVRIQTAPTGRFEIGLHREWLL